MELRKQYLGDSVYVEDNGFGVTLTTENGYGPNNKRNSEFHSTVGGVEAGKPRTPTTFRNETVRLSGPNFPHGK